MYVNLILKKEETDIVVGKGKQSRALSIIKAASLFALGYFSLMSLVVLGRFFLANP